MAQREDNWKDLFQERLADYEASPERDLWPEIEERLSGKKKPIWLWRSSWLVAASIVLLLGLMWVLHRESQPGQGPGMAQQGPLALRETPVDPAPDQAIISDSPAVEYADLGMPQLAETTEVLQRPQTTPPNQDPPVADLSTKATPTDPPRKQQEAMPASRRYQQVGPLQPVMPEQLQSRNDVERPEIRNTIALTDDAPARVAPSARRTVVQGEHQTINLQDMTLNDAVNLASDNLTRWVRTPIEMYREETEAQKVRIFEIDLLNLRITRKTAKRTN